MSETKSTTESAIGILTCIKDAMLDKAMKLNEAYIRNNPANNPPHDLDLHPASADYATALTCMSEAISYLQKGLTIEAEYNKAMLKKAIANKKIEILVNE